MSGIKISTATYTEGQILTLIGRNGFIVSASSSKYSVVINNILSYTKS